MGPCFQGIGLCWGLITSRWGIGVRKASFRSRGKHSIYSSQYCCTAAGQQYSSSIADKRATFEHKGGHRPMSHDSMSYPDGCKTCTAQCHARPAIATEAGGERERCASVTRAIRTTNEPKSAVTEGAVRSHHAVFSTHVEKVASAGKWFLLSVQWRK